MEEDDRTNTQVCKQTNTHTGICTVEKVNQKRLRETGSQWQTSVCVTSKSDQLSLINRGSREQ